MNELVQRILTGSAMAAVTLLLIFKSSIGFALFVAMGGLVVGYEFVKLSKMKPITLWLVLALIATLFYINTLPTSPYGSEAYALLFNALLLYAIVAFWLKNLFLVVNYPNNKPSNSEFNKAISLFLLIMSLALLLLLQIQSVSVLLLLLLIVWGTDSFAYFSGKAFGKRKLAPNLSGGKTIEGVVGGLIGVLLITGAWMFVTDNLDWRYLPLALITGIFSVVGDLYESIYKREAGVKDSGNILPGHGGMFDRLDGVLAATPIFFVGLAFLT